VMPKKMQSLCLLGIRSNSSLIYGFNSLQEFFTTKDNLSINTLSQVIAAIRVQLSEFTLDNVRHICMT